MWALTQGFGLDNQNTQELKCLKSLGEVFPRSASAWGSESSSVPSGGQS